MSKIVLLSFLLTMFLFSSCTSTTDIETDYGNPHSNGFNLEESDPKAIEIADLVMEAMGGRQNWDDTRYLKWNFFGSRRHVWDRHSGEVIIEGIRDSFYSKVNINTLEGSVNLKGLELTKADSLDKYLERSKNMWINDSYWLIFPYKLKDSGVTLKYINLDTTAKGSPAHVLQLTFNEVGKTPQNKYQAYVDTSSNLITQWDFYPSFEDSVPRFTTPWLEYKIFDRVLISSNRGPNYDIEEISTSDTLANYFVN